MYKDNIGIIGLGKLGLPMMGAFISRGFDPKGYDINQKLVEKLRKRVCPYQEPGLKEIIESDAKWAERFYTDLDKFLESIDTIFIIVPTPTKIDIFDISFLEDVLCNVAKNKNKEKVLTCVVTSTVNPGDCAKLSIKYKKEQIQIVYSPEFIALGSVLKDMLDPDIVLLGGDEIGSVDKVFSIYSRLYKSHPEYHRLTHFESETAKIAINTYITTKISYANTIGLYVEQSTKDRLSAQRVLNAIGGDSRIGRKYFKFGVSYGGPCFPRDNRALAAHLKKIGVDPAIPEATDKINNFILENWKNRINNEKYDALVLVGVAYKSGTDFLEESFMIKLALEVRSTTDIYYVDANVPNCEEFSRINTAAELDLLKKYVNPIILVNYNNTEIDLRCANCKIVNIWG
jgi:UDPglucose 6-dehydrogenase